MYSRIDRTTQALITAYEQLFTNPAVIRPKRIRNLATYWARRSYLASPQSDKLLPFCPISLQLADGNEVALTPIWVKSGTEDSPQVSLHNVRVGWKDTITDEDCVVKYQFPIAWNVDVVDHSLLQLFLPPVSNVSSSDEPEPR